MLIFRDKNLHILKKMIKFAKNNISNMDWKILFVLAAFLIYWAYNQAALGIFGVPKSLSMTFYLFQERKKWQRILFPIMMISMAGFLLPAWLEISEGNDLQFMTFFAAAGIMFTGAAPAFNSSDLENKVHSISAIFAAVFALLWVAFVAHLWYFIIVWFVIITLVAILSKTVKSSYIYWLETIAFMSTFTAVIAYYVGLLV
jgi:hypothetical protein